MTLIHKEIFGCDTSYFGYIRCPLGIWRSAFGGVLHKTPLPRSSLPPPPPPPPPFCLWVANTGQQNKNARDLWSSYHIAFGFGHCPFFSSTSQNDQASNLSLSSISIGLDRVHSSCDVANDMCSANDNRQPCLSIEQSLPLLVCNKKWFCS